jgi:hypothetical protein
MSRNFLFTKFDDNQTVRKIAKKFFKKSCENIWSVSGVVVILHRFCGSQDCQIA